MINENQTFSFFFKCKTFWLHTLVSEKKKKNHSNIKDGKFTSHETLDVFNPYLTNGFSHHYQLDESTFIFRGVRSDFLILFNFSMKNL